MPAPKRSKAMAETEDRLSTLMERYRTRVDDVLHKTLPNQNLIPKQLHAAMRYSTLNGGKRIRPFLVYATGEALSADPVHLDGPAAAIELIHAYSLVHDDLPAMDNDNLRRGKPTCHIAFDEATAVLAGDALQSLAFQVIAREPADATPLPTQARLKMVEQLAGASGSRGMAGGQAIDLAAVGQTLDLPALENMHIHKTGALIRASVAMGALCAPQLTPTILERLDHYAKCIGLAFQIQDDILDVETDTATLGKPQGADQALNKPTYPALLGLEGARERAQALSREAIDSLADLDASADPLRWMADYIVSRRR